jgi:hypothetical protein
VPDAPGRTVTLAAVRLAPPPPRRPWLAFLSVSLLAAVVGSFLLWAWQAQLEEVVDDGQHGGPGQAQPPREVGLRDLLLRLDGAQHEGDVAKSHAGGV